MEHVRTIVSCFAARFTGDTRRHRCTRQERKQRVLHLQRYSRSLSSDRGQWEICVGKRPITRSFNWYWGRVILFIQDRRSNDTLRLIEPHTPNLELKQDVDNARIRLFFVMTRCLGPVVKHRVIHLAIILIFTVWRWPLMHDVSLTTLNLQKFTIPSRIPWVLVKFLANRTRNSPGERIASRYTNFIASLTCALFSDTSQRMYFTFGSIKTAKHPVTSDFRVILSPLLRATMAETCRPLESCFSATSYHLRAYHLLSSCLSALPQSLGVSHPGRFVETLVSERNGVLWLNWSRQALSELFIVWRRCHTARRSSHGSQLDVPPVQNDTNAYDNFVYLHMVCDLIVIANIFCVGWC